MPSINLIAARRADKKRQENNLRVLAFAIAGEIGLAAVIIAWMFARLVVVNVQISKLDGQIAKLKPKVDEIQMLQKQTAEMQPKVATLQGARADTLFWYNNLYALIDCLPAQTWLSSLTTAGGNAAGGPGLVSGGDPTLSIAGTAPTETAVGEAMLRMNHSPNLDHVDLSGVNQQRTGDVDTVSFQMTVHLKPETAPAAGGDANGKKS